MKVINNRVYLDGKATNEYVCDCCGDRVSSLCCEDVYGEEKQICSECAEGFDYAMEKGTKDLYLIYLNDYLTVSKFAEDYNLSESVARLIIEQGRIEALK